MTTELPDEVTEVLRQEEVTTEARLEKIAEALVSKRKDAISARKESGIEEVWLAAEEAYLGIDDATRGKFNTARWAKPTTLSGTVTTGITKSTADENKSDAFVRLTSRYVDAGAAKLGEILLPADEKAFSFTATPVPDLISKLKDTTPIVENGTTLEREARPGETPGSPGAAPTPPGGLPPASPAGTPPAAPGTLVPLTVKDVAEEAIELANQAAKKAEKRIHDWMVESRYRAEMRKVIFDAARIGVGVLKGPFPRKKVSKAYDAATGAVTVQTTIRPAYEWKDPWNIYPDPACGEDLHNGDHTFEVEPFSAKQLRKLKGTPGYISSAIDKVLAAGPQHNTSEYQKPGEVPNKHRYLVWHFYGTMKREDMIVAGALKPEEKTNDDVYAICTLVNDVLIRATINPLDSGEFPYHSVPWQRRPGHWAGVGVGEQLEMPQRAINAAIRACFNNAGKSSGSVIILDKDVITPQDGTWALTPDKIFLKSPEATADDVRKAMTFFQVPNMTPQLLSIIELCFRLAEESTSIPLITQGQSGPTTPDTFGAAQLQNNNANQLLRSVGYSVDDYITEPVVNQSYEYLLLDPDIPADEKGDWSIDAHGSVALVERAIQDQTIQNMMPILQDPGFGGNKKRWFAEFLRSKHMNPLVILNTPEEQAKLDQTPPPPLPQVQVAQIKSADAEKALAAEANLRQAEITAAQTAEQIKGEVKLQIAEIRKNIDELRVQSDTDRDTTYVQAETARTQAEYDVRNRELEIRRELAILEYANKRELSLNDVKKDLAKTQATLQVQRELAGVANQVDLVKHVTPPAAKPAAEPAGKAPNGESFTK